MQSARGKLDTLLDEVARTSAQLPKSNERNAITISLEQYKSLIGGINDRVSATLKTIETYEANWPRRHSSNSVFSIAAFAEMSAVSSAISSIDSLRPAIMIGVIGAITVFFFICVVLFCYTSDADKLKFADNMMRTIVGFYIGIVTGLLGLPGK